MNHQALIILFLLNIGLWTKADSESESEITVNRRIFITNGELRLVESSGKLSLAASDPIKLLVYSDGTIRDIGGRCVTKINGGHAALRSGNTCYELKQGRGTYEHDGECLVAKNATVKFESCQIQQQFVEHPWYLLTVPVSTSTQTVPVSTSTQTVPVSTSTQTVPVSTSTQTTPTSSVQQDPIYSTTPYLSASLMPPASSTQHVEYTSTGLAFSYSTAVLSESSEIASMISPSSSITTTPISSYIVNNTTKLPINNLYLANHGQQCQDFCSGIGKICTNTIVTGNSEAVFTAEGVHCLDVETRKLWKHAYDPSFHVNKSICAGYIAVNESGISCYIEGFNDANIRRLCKCLISDDEDKFGPWVPWSTCSASCDGGVQTRTRICNADACSGSTTDSRNCNTHPCPIDGGFSEWSSWSACTKTCGGGEKNRTRVCNNPYPQHGGLDCFGERSKKDLCNLQFCPVHGSWSQWTKWSACDKPCNGGGIKRWRFCNNPSPLYGGNDCSGNGTEAVSCNEKLCPAENITVTGVKFDYLWNSTMAVKSSTAFINFHNVLELNVKRVFMFSDVNSTYVTSAINSLRKGSVLSTFVLYFTGLDSFQILLLQEAIENDKYLGKLKIIGANQTYNTSIVPSSPPLNFTLTPLTTTSIKASWQEPPKQKQNGNVSGYILFYRERLQRSEPYKSIATANLNVTLLGLKVFTEYTFRVLAYNENGNGIATSEKYVYTRESVPSQPPGNVSAIGTTGFTAIVEWLHVTQEQWNGLPVGSLVKFDDLKGHKGNVTVPFPDSSFVLNGLVPVTTYVLDVCEMTAPGAGPCQRVQATTLPSPPSKAPDGVNIEDSLWHDQIRITWNPINSKYVHGDLLGYKIRYQLINIAGQAVVGIKKIIRIIHPSLTNITLTGLESNAQYYFQVLAFNGEGDGKSSAVMYGGTCACPLVMYTNFAASAPYIYRDSSGNMKGLLADILYNVTQYTCGTCKRVQKSQLDFKSNGKNGWAEKRSLREMKNDIDNFIDISFPAFGSTELVNYYGYPFVPVFSHPGVVYFIIKDTLKDHVTKMLNSVVDTWPIFLINVLFIIISGYCIWVLEARGNPGEFPPHCVPGVLDGMYWAFITMGTHGYGDITPRGIASRIFAVIWILIGMINLAIFTGALTTAITASQVYDDPRLYGVEVAAVHDSVAHRIAILRNAKVNTKAEYKTIEDVATALKSRQVRGALVDVYSAASRGDLFSQSDIVAKKNIKYPSAYGFVLSGDMKNAAPSFRNYLSGQADSILSYMEDRASGLEINEETGEAVSIFDPDSPFLVRVFITVCVLIAIGFGIGTCYYFYNKRCVLEKVHSDDSSSVQELEKLCEETLTQLEQAISEKIETKFELHLEKRVAFISKGQTSVLRGIFASLTCRRNHKENRVEGLKASNYLGHETIGLDTVNCRQSASRATYLSAEEKADMEITSRYRHHSIHSNASLLQSQKPSEMPEVS